MHSRTALTGDFRKLGVAAGDTVMLHASVRSVGEIIGGPDDIHLALEDVLTAEGTLIMYLGCPRFYDEVGRGNLTAAEEAEVLESLPAFDPLTARAAQSHGVLAEFFRTFPGSMVNSHVARFAAWGRRAEALLSEQPWNYALGHRSVLERFVAADGVVLLLGSDHDAVTLLHHVEHVAPIAGRNVARYKVPIEVDGRKVWRDQEEFDTSTAAHPNWPDRFFARIVDTFLQQTNNRGSLVGDARAYLIPAPALCAFALRVMTEVATDPLAADRLLQPSLTASLPATDSFRRL